MPSRKPTQRNRRHAAGRHGRWTTLQSLGPVVYAIRLDHGVIKIGFTTNLADRERTVRRQSGSKTCELLAFQPGTIDDEQELHAALLDHLAHGREYYHPTPAVLEVVNHMRETCSLPPIAA